MPAVKYDVEDVESGGGGEEPQPGTYPGKIVSMVHRKTKSNSKEVISDFEITCDIGKEFVRLWTYVKLPDDPNYSKESHGWKLRELTDALGLPPKGSIDPAKITKDQPAVMVKVTSDTHRDTGEYRGKIKNLFPPSATNGSRPDPEEAEGSGDTGPYGEAEISTWSDDDLKGYAEELGVDVPAGRGWKAKLITALVEAEEAPEDTPDNPQGEPSTGDSLSDFDDDLVTEIKNVAEQGSDYIASWEDDDIKWFVDGLKLETPVTGRGWKPKAITAIVDACSELVGGDGSGDGEAAEPEDDYEDVDDAGNLIWPDADLKAEIASRNEQGADIEVPRGRTSRAKLLELLRADDATAIGKEPF